MHGLQKPQLHHRKKPGKYQRQIGSQKVLQALPQSPGASRSQNLASSELVHSV